MRLNSDCVPNFSRARRRRLKILIYCHDWAPSVGGIQTVYMSLAKGMSQRSNSERDGDTDVAVRLITSTSAQGMDDSQLSFYVLRRPSLLELIRQIRWADVLHVAGPAFLPLVLGWLLRKPIVLEHHGYQSVCPNGLLLYGPDRTVCPGHFMAGDYRKCIQCNSESLGAVKNFWSLALTFPRRWFAGKATVNVVPSLHLGLRITLPRTRTIYHGTPRRTTLSGGDTANNNRQPCCFAYVGRLVAEKGIPVLLRASSQLSRDRYDFRIKIVGDGPERFGLELMAQTLGLKDRIEFLGSVDKEAISSLLAEVTAVIMPSVCEDVAPLVAIEQMMQGRLIIASDIGGLGEIVDGVGLKFRPGDSNGLESCMRKVLENPGLAKELGKRAQRRAWETFDEERMIEQHVQLHRGVCEPCPRKSE